MNVIEFDRATIKIGGHIVLADTSLAIKRGESACPMPPRSISSIG